MARKSKKNMVITKKEHDEWHRKNRDYEGKNSKEHEACHEEIGLVVKG